MKKILFVVLAVLFLSNSWAKAAESSYPQRCYFSGTYDEGYFSKTVWDMWVADKTGGDLSKYIIYSFLKVSEIPPQLMAPGSELEKLLKLKIIAIARFLPTAHASHEVMVLRKDSFQFIHENSDLTPFVILMNAFGDQPILIELLKDSPNNILQSKIVGPIEQADAVCNF